MFYPTIAILFGAVDRGGSLKSRHDGTGRNLMAVVDVHVPAPPPEDLLAVSLYRACIGRTKSKTRGARSTRNMIDNSKFKHEELFYVIEMTHVVTRKSRYFLF
mmetsp:Transcript_39309/g.47251  ORF Transcript_39309/g.47251 Transcript_39309/m.47251 type:complete len:103 (-) Transcript_39309:60-368(-)